MTVRPRAASTLGAVSSGRGFLPLGAGRGLRREELFADVVTLVSAHQCLGDGPEHSPSAGGRAASKSLSASSLRPRALAK